MADNTYHDQKNAQNIKLLRKVLEELPEFARDYFRSIEPSTSPSTRFGYAYDLRTFFSFIISKNPAYKSIKDLSLDILEALQPVDLEEYQEYVLLYEAADGSSVKMAKTLYAEKCPSFEAFMTITSNGK